MIAGSIHRVGRAIAALILTFLHATTILITTTAITTRTVVEAANFTPSLPFGDINILVVTDVHSFIAGHPHEVNRDADYGQVFSFYQRIKEYCDEQGADLWFFMNGDWVHGTGLAMDGNATMLVPLLKQMPWDAVNLGNHESYKSAIVNLMHKEMVPHFGPGFVTSNTLLASTMEPFGGSRYRLLQGTNNTLLVFGFLYNLHNPSHLLHVSRVEEVLEEDWFRLALLENKYDAICVLAHMDNDDPLIDRILSKIREHTQERMPVQFLTGHTHFRKQRKIGKDLWSRAMEAGGNLDTIGFVSIPTIQTATSVAKLGESGRLFQYEFLDSNKRVLADRAGVEPLLTDEGSALTQRIQDTRHRLGLDQVVGCPPKDYFMNRSIHADDSLYKLWIERIAPSQVFDRNSNSAMIISSSNLRYDARGSGKNDAMTVDDIVAIVPYMESVVYIGEVPEWVVRRMNISMNTHSLNHKHLYPDYLLAGSFDHAGDKNKPYKLYTHEYNLAAVMSDLDRLYQHNLKPTTTQLKDTLYWLHYASTAWPCPGHYDPVDVKPWFADMKVLDDEATDGGETSEDSDTTQEKAKGKKGKKNKDKDSNSDLHYEGYHGYLPPSTIEQFGDKLPAGISTSVPLKPQEKVPVVKTDKKSNVKHSAAAFKAERMEHRKKIKRILIRALGGIMAVSLLLIPLCGLYRVIFPDKQSNPMSDETFYDMKEMRAFQRRKQVGGHRPMHEIQLT